MSNYEYRTMTLALSSADDCGCPVPARGALVQWLTPGTGRTVPLSQEHQALIDERRWAIKVRKGLVKRRPRALAVVQRARVAAPTEPTEDEQWAEAFAAGETVTAYEDASNA